MKDQQPGVFNKVESLRKLGREVYYLNCLFQHELIVNYYSGVNQMVIRKHSMKWLQM